MNDSDPSESAMTTAGSMLRLTEDEQQYLLGLARDALKAVTAGTALPQVPASATASGNLSATRSCFVTLYKDGSLRGCVGSVRATEPLWKAVLESVRAAALRDPRFPAVTSDEVGRIRLEISILGPARVLRGASADELLAQIVPGKHGVILRASGAMATFLPQVWEQIPAKVEFFNALARKGGMDRDAWLRNDAEISVYGVTRVEER